MCKCRHVRLCVLTSHSAMWWRSFLIFNDFYVFRYYCCCHPLSSSDRNDRLKIFYYENFTKDKNEENKIPKSHVAFTLLIIFISLHYFLPNTKLRFYECVKDKDSQIGRTQISAITFRVQEEFPTLFDMRESVSRVLM